jgi:hypothetical protein
MEEDVWISFVLWLVLPIMVAIAKIKWNWFFLIPVIVAFTLIVSGLSFANDKIDLILVGFGISSVWVGLHYFVRYSGGNKVVYFIIIFLGMFTYVLIPNKMSVGIQGPNKVSHEDGFIIKARACIGTSAKSGTDIAVSKCIGPEAIFEEKVLSATDFSSSYIAYGGVANFTYNEIENELYVEWFDGQYHTGIDTFSKRNDFIQMHPPRFSTPKHTQ